MKKAIAKTLKSVGAMLAVLTVTVLLYLMIVIFAPGFDVAKQPIPTKKSRGKKRPEAREDVTFAVEGVTIRGWLYLPQDTSRPVPCIIMSHGFGGTKDFLLERYALRFAESGFAALTYDYRHFGASEGQPRQLFAINYQLDDLRAAIAYARQRREIHPDSIVLWGTSSSGGYGVCLAAEDAQVAAVIGQCAGLDHDADSAMYMERNGIGYFLRLFMHAQRDKGRSRFGLSPHTVPIVGKPGTLAMHNAPGAYEGYVRMAEVSETFQNEICARSLLTGHGPDPVEAAHRVCCPTLLLVCEYDNLVSPDSHVRAAQILGEKVQVEKYPIGHFDIYEGQHFEKAVDTKIAFLRAHFPQQ